MQARDMALEAARALDEKKGLDITILDVQHLTIITDYFVIVTGRSAPQVRALTDAVDERMSKLGYDPRRKEGVSEGRWAVLDYGSMLVHIFHEQERSYYNLERLWEDGSNRLAFEAQAD